jgi:hypothetical protein
MVEHLHYNDKELPIRINYYALKHTQEDLNREFDLKTPAGWDFEVLECLLFYGLQRGHEVEGAPFEFKKEDMEKVMDVCFNEFLDIIPKSFGATEKPLPVTKGKRSAPGKKESAAGPK